MLCNKNDVVAHTLCEYLKFCSDSSDWWSLASSFAETPGTKTKQKLILFLTTWQSRIEKRKSLDVDTWRSLWRCRQTCTVFDRLFLFFSGSDFATALLYFILLYFTCILDWASRRLRDQLFCPFPGPLGCVTRWRHGYLGERSSMRTGCQTGYGFVRQQGVKMANFLSI